ncbi:SDR family oxidoreductase [Gloeocapsa sp. BRSZ]
MTQRFEGKTILITGGSSGMGEAAAQGILNEGGRVIITGRKQQSLDEAIARFDYSKRARAIAADVSDLDALDQLMKKIRAEFSTLDGIFANAGFGKFESSLESNEEDFDVIFGANVKGVFYTIQKGLALLQNPGAIVINASWVAHRGLPNGALYSATKAAVQSFVETLTAEFGRKGIRINSISPGIIATPILEKIGMNEEETKFWEGQIPLGRLGNPEEVANLVVFLLSEEASYIAGEDILIDGGLTRTVAM